MFARELTETVQADFGCSSELIDLESFNPSQLKQDELSVFVCASFGKGEPTDNAKKFNNWLAQPEEAIKPLVQDTPFAVFGCGMSCTYPENYQAFPKHIESRLQTLGAKEVVPRGEGDDSKDIEDDFHNWYASALKPLLSLPPGTSVIGQAITEAHEHVQPSVCQARIVEDPVAIQPPPAEIVAEVDKVDLLLQGATKQQQDVTTFSWDHPFMATVTKVKTLTTPDHIMRTAKHFEFDLTTAPAGTMTYETGDYLAVIPTNLRAVDSVIKLLHWTGEEKLKSSSFLGIPRLPREFTSREALTHYFDIRNPPKRSVIRTLSEFAKNPFERRTLMHLGATTENNEASPFYQQYILRDNRGIATILRDFPSIQVDPETLISRLSPLKPRLYSIANSAAQSGISASICMTVLFGPAPDGRPWYGTNSYYLDKTAVGDKIPIFVQKSSIRLPADPQAPLIMVAVGTGISLMRSFWQERCVDNPSSGPNYFFFGTNGPTDNLYHEEIDGLSNLTTFRSFTFDPVEPTFIQYRFAQNGRKMVDLILNENAHMVVCGHKALGGSIRDALLTLLRKHGSMHYHEAGEYLSYLKSSGRYTEEIFQ